MNNVELTEEQIQSHRDAWENAAVDSMEKRLIEDIFLITGTAASPAGPVHQPENRFSDNF